MMVLSGEKIEIFLADFFFLIFCCFFQDGLLLNSRCTLYKSAMEEVFIWGWPLQTAGLLTTGFSSRSFTILSGRVTEVSAKHSSYLL